MKTVKTLFTILFISLLFSGCDNYVTVSNEKTIPENNKVMISLSLRNNNARTALPDFDWRDFNFELIAVENPGEATQKDPVVLFENRAYEQLVQGILLDESKYKFTLNAYRESQKVFSGQQIVDLSSGNTNLSFMMYPVANGKGSASITITYPLDGPTAKIIAFTSEEIFDDKPGIQLTSKIVSGHMKAVYEVSDLPSDKEQYAIIKFYDSNNTLIYSCAEGLIISNGLVSKSEIHLTDNDWHTYTCVVTLKKDGKGWSSSGKTVSLVNKTNSEKVYPLTEYSKGEFDASVAEGLYYIYVNGENTGIEFNSVDKKIDVNYYTVSMNTERKCKMLPVSGGIDQAENLAVVQEGHEFVYKLSYPQGYEVNNLIVKENDLIIPNANFENLLTITSVNQSIKVTIEGITPIVYIISYKDNETELQSGEDPSLAFWFDFDSPDKSYTPPTTFTVENTISLPTIENVRKKGNYFDAWTTKDGNIVINTEGLFENLYLDASWRPAPKVDNQNKVIYANGFNLLIKGSETSGKDDKKNSSTSIFVDYNGDGIKNQDDYQITCKNITTTKDNDFTGYELRAGSDDGSYIPRSDFIFTMTGGNISAIYGLNSKTQKYPNKSTLNISGTAQIGIIEEKQTRLNPDSTTTTYAKNVKGIMLDTLSAERVFITDQMNNLEDSAKTPYSVTCVTENKYEIDTEHIVAEITNSNYATLANFTCWNVMTDEKTYEKSYTQILLAHKEELINSITKTYIRMADDSGVVFPKHHELEWNADEFHLGSSLIKKPCSVFSLAVENGVFRVNERTTITKNKTDNDLAVEATLTYMAQPTPLTYVERLTFEESYVYMQVLSSNDLLTPESINYFLSQVFFRKIDESKPITISVNIETVPAKFILGDGDGAGGSEYKYFNGSFYKRYQYENDTAGGYNKVTLGSGLDKGKQAQLIKWTESYNKSKQKSFNGLKGYLMNITSEVENNYIYDTYFKLNPNQLSWAGGAAVIPVMTMTGMLTGETVTSWDLDVTPTSLLGDSNAVSASTAANAKKNADRWYWQAGPEAGKCFWGTAVILTQADANKGAEERDCSFDRWNNSEFLHNDSSIYDSSQNFDLPVAPSVLLRGRECKEPNGKQDRTVPQVNGGVKFTGTNEQYLQFLAGELQTETGNYRANGFWNNQGDKNDQTNGFGCTGYIVEFTPYETEYGKQVANYQAIKRSATYE